MFSTIVAFGLVMVGSSSASAEDPTPAPTVSAKSTPGKKLCKIGDTELTEISGLATTKNGFAVINDGRIDGGTAKIYFLNRECKKVKEASFDGTPLDAEDIVLSPDGQTLWIADTGDNNVRNDPSDTRPHVALWSIPVSGNGEAVIHRVKYPDKDKHDAEALIFDGDGTPLIVTKEVGAPAGVYKPATALKKNSNTPVPLERVGEIKLSATETAGNPIARIGNKTITGGAVTENAGKVVLRTYTDALEWDVSGGDVIAALKKEPRTTGLPNEQLGEAIAYSSDGKLFYTVSDMSGVKETANHIREYTPATTVAAKSTKSADADGGSSWITDLGIDGITYIVGGIGVLGLILVGAGVFGIMRFRKSPQGRADDDDDLMSGGPHKGDPETELIGVGGAPQRGASYGSGRAGGGGPVYGAAAQSSGPASGGPQRGSGVYGGPGGGGKGAGGQGGGGQGGGKGGGPQYGRPAGQQPRGPQQAPSRSPQQAPPRNPQQAPSRNTQQAPRGPQQAPGRGGPQQQPPRGPQQPPRGPQQGPGGGGGGVYGGQQPPRGPQGQAPRSPGTYGGNRPPGPDGRR
ncbi:hypothetical protein Ait01nite_002410 [Actinoplanes italicus]|nr:hypothetical protein Ait01nite_002410 [Actinoplanes italicus]